MKLLDLPLKTLIERYDKSQTHGEQGDVLNDDYWDIPLIFQDLLHFANANEVNKALTSVEKRIEQVEAKLRNHRHENKSFSAKAEF